MMFCFCQSLVAIVAGAVAIGIVILAVSVLITIWKCKRKVKGMTDYTSECIYCNSIGMIQLLFFLSVEATEKNFYTERYVK